MRSTIRHPAACVGFDVPGGLELGGPQPALVNGRGTSRSQVLRSGADRVGQVTVTSGATTGRELDARELVSSVLVRGTLSEIEREGDPTQGWRVSFRLDGAPYYSRIQRRALDPGGQITVAMWGPREEAALVDARAEQLAGSLGIQAAQEPQVGWQRAVLAGIVSMNILQALASLAGGVPVYGHFSSSEAVLFFSVVVLGCMCAFFYGLIKRRGWGVYGLASSCGILSASALLLALLVPASSGPGYRYVIPALEAGGAHALLWVLNVPLNILAVVLVAAFHERLVRDEP